MSEQTDAQLAASLCDHARYLEDRKPVDLEWRAVTYHLRLAAQRLEARGESEAQWQPIESEPSDGSEVWISDGATVWLGTAHTDGSLRLPSRSRCKFWMPANKPLPPQHRAALEAAKEA